MKAQILRKQGPIETNLLSFEEVDLPEPREKEVRLKVLANALCLTDRHIIEGDIPAKKLPLIPGHQIVGIVEKVGPGASKSLIGKKVGVFWLHHTCGCCCYCSSGLENLCPSASFTGYDADGGYAEYAVAKEDYVIPLGDEIDPISFAPLLCSGIVGYRSYKLAEAKPYSRIGLFGFGSAAYLTLQIAKHFHSEVYVFTRSPKHQEIAKSLGAISATSIDTPPKELLDSAIIFAPSGPIVPKALSYLKRGGTLAVNAIHTSDIPTFSYDLLYYEKTVRSVSNATREDAHEFLSLAAKIPIQTHVEVYPLKEANKALLAHKESKVETSIIFVP